MGIKWSNVVVFAMGIFAFFTAVRMQDQIFSFFGTMASYGPGSSVNDNVHGLMAFGLLIVVVLALVKIVLNSQNSN